MLTNKALQPSRKQPPQVAERAPSPSFAFPSPPTPAPQQAVPSMAEERDPFRKIAFFGGLGYLFLRLGVIPELLYSFLGVNTYLLYFFAPVAIIGSFATGGLRRTFQSKVAWFWAAFFGWMVLATPMSYWIGGSFQRIMNYGRVDVVFLFIMGGLVLNWKEIRYVFYTVALAAVLNVWMSQGLGGNDFGGRTNLNGVVGSISNSNDLASHLLLVLPFLGFVVVDRKRNALFRVGALAVIGLGLIIVLGTGSRGALIGIALSTLFLFFNAGMKQKVALVFCLVVVGALAPLILPESTMTRLGSLFGEEHVEAEESSRSREYLFKKSLEYTFDFPIFGVGPDQFPNYEGQQQVSAGLIGNWHATHCAWTQVSAECGIPALIFFVSGLTGALLLMHRVRRRAQREGFLEIRNAALCYLTGMIGHLGAITFLANAYEYYLPAMVGLAISFCYVANRYMDQSRAAKTATPGLQLATA